MNEAAADDAKAQERPPRVSLAARLALRCIRLYQHLFAFRPSPCRFVPSCSNYALDAYEYRGALVGTWLTVKRLARCNPWGGHGWDPVPGSPSHGHEHEYGCPGHTDLTSRGAA